MSMLQECVLHIYDYLPISFIDSLPISIQRLVVTTHPGFHVTARRFKYIEYLTRLRNLTHVGGFHWTQFSIAEEKDYFLHLSALTKLEYIGIEGTHSPFMWIPLQNLKDEGFAPETKHLMHSQVFPWEISWDGNS
ncbi:hypothetical protein M422DRAFT_256392 [Sphaerobolus stellatus SS14]|uniref:Uncharacterized protein n=1 Tax=Sphaerobolus stellatus (strain SS14) TaxID=990650 RepID=A0A0C9VGZ8_SPHS4|nr:hypothetical protein M422DRAFT_256392 [Sphaerobolus stellatus SS14]